MAEPKKLSPMMQKKLAAQQAQSATAEAKTDAPAQVSESTAQATPAATKPALKTEGASTMPSTMTTKLVKNPNGERYGYGDGLASVFGTPPAIDDAYNVVRIISKIPATVLDGVITFFKKVTS